MASSLSFVQYVCDQIQSVGFVRYKKMFGEYMVYVDDKPILLICDDTVFVKIKKEIEHLMKASEQGFPYSGSKLHYILDIDQKETTHHVIQLLLQVTPIPKKKPK